MEQWKIDGVTYTVSPEAECWSTGEALTFKARPTWRSIQHPRDEDGRFAETGDPVRLISGQRGTFQGVDARSGRIRVRLDSGQERLILRAQVRFDRKPKPKPKPTSAPAATPAATVPDAPLPPSPLIETPGEAAKAKVDMAASQRAAINELNIDSALVSDTDAQQGAAALRANKPLTGLQAETLAAVVRARAESSAITKPKRNSLLKGAEWLDTVVAQTRGFKPSTKPDLDKAAPVEIEQVQQGDLIALPGKGGKADVRQVVEVKAWYGVYKVTVTGPNGAEETRFVAPGTPLYRFADTDHASALKTHDADGAGEDPKALYDDAAAVQALKDALGTGGEEPAPKKNQGPGAVAAKETWYDKAAVAGENSEPVPVAGLTVEGHTIANGVSWRRNGRSYLVELAPGESAEEAKERGDRAAALLEQTLSVVPPEKAKLQRGLALLQASNPADSYWAKKYNMPGFHSGATGGFGSTTMWGGAEPKPTILAHEFGHTIDSTAFGVNQWLSQANGPVVEGQELSWEQSGERDKAVSGTYAGQFKETRLHPFVKPIVPGQKGVTEYGSVDVREDFAESVRLWMKDRREGKLGYNPDTGENVRFSDMFPERAKTLDAAFDTKTDVDTPVRQRLRKEAEDQFLTNLEAVEQYPAVTLLTPDDLFDTAALPLDEVKAAQVRAKERLAKESADAQAKAEAAAAKAKLDEEQAAAKAEALTEVASVKAALGAGKLEKADAAKFRAKVTAYKKKLREQGLSETEVAQMAAAFETSLLMKHFGLDSPWISAQTSAKWNSDDAAAADAWVKDAGNTVHPLAEKQWGGGPPQAKANISAELSSRLNTPEDWEKLRAWIRGSSYNGDGDLGEFDDLSEKERHDKLAEEVSNRLTQWAANSGDSRPDSILFQEAVKQEFGVTGHSAPTFGEEKFTQLMQDRWADAGPWLMRVARAQYEHSQEEFAAAGITHVSAYRGMEFGHSWRPDWVQPDAQVAGLQPVNSWSTQRKTAMMFTHMYGHPVRIMMKARIPVELILGSARTGMGCLGEQEFLVFDSSGEAHIEIL